MLMTLDSMVDSEIHINVYLTFISIHMCAIFKDSLRLSQLPLF